MLKAHKQIGNERNNAGPCINYEWNHDGLIVWLSKINDSLLMKNKKVLKLCGENAGKINWTTKEEIREYGCYKIATVSSDHQGCHNQSL